jgi:hypothetical protein
LPGLKEPAVPKGSSLFSFMDMMGVCRVNLSIAT